MKICIIGTSHASCLFAGWKNISDDNPDISISFYFNGGGYFGKFQVNAENKTVEIDDDDIRARFVKLSGGDGSLNFENFDACVIVGGFFYRPIGCIAELGDQTNHNYSSQVKSRAIEDIFTRIHANKLIPKIREVSDIPIFLIHDPFQTLNPDKPNSEMVNPFTKYDYERGVGLLNLDVLMPNRVWMLLQPSETIEAPYFSKREYGLKRRKATQSEIDAGHVGEYMDDNRHLNADYGALRLQTLIQEISGLLQE